MSNLIVHDVSKWGIACWDSGITTVRNCVVYDVGEFGIILFKGTPTIENCTVDGTGSLAGIYFLDTPGAPDVTIRNTISVGSSFDFAAYNGTVTVNYFGYNMYATSYIFDPEAYDDNNQTPPADLDDLFISTTVGSEDYNLEWDGHEAWDTGLDLSATFTTDITDTTRTVPWEMGAYKITGVINRRSIGTNAATLHNTGNASITQDTKTVTFSSATLPTTIGEGDELVINGETFYIYSRDSASQVTTQAAAASTHSNFTYTIKRAYNSPQAWEDDREGDLVADNRREVGVGYNVGAFASLLVIDGSTADSQRYMHLTVAPGHRHHGIAGAGVRIDAGGGLGNVGIRVKDYYTRVDWWEITGILDGYACANPTSGPYSRFEYLLIHNFGGTATSRGIHCNEVGIIIRNCILYDAPTADVGIRLTGDDTIVENCTVYGIGGDGIRQYAANTAEIRNTISVGNGTDFDCLGTLDYFGNNMFDTFNNFVPTDYDGGNQTPPSNLDGLFVDITPGSEDLHLEWEGHDALKTGLDLSSSFTTDIDGDTRLAPWDMGADKVMPSNYRSIGTTVGTIYSAGTATIGVGASVVTFFGATLPANIGAGDKLTINSEEFYIFTRDSDTQVSVQGVAATDHVADTYTIARVFDTLQAWEDARGGDLVTVEVREIGVCYNDGPLTARLIISGSTTSSDYFMMVTVAEGQRHNGLPNTGAAIDPGGGFSGSNAIDVEDEYTRIEWLEVRGDADGGHGIFFNESPFAADNGLVSNVFVHSYVQSVNSGVEIRAQNVTVRNSFFTGGTSVGIRLRTGSSATIENCTLYGDDAAGSGVDDEAGATATIRNTISVNHPTGNDFVLNANIAFFGNNMFSTVTGFDPDLQDGGNQWPPQNLEHLFVSKSTPDLHLESKGNYAANGGLDLSASFSNDIDNSTRTGTWDIGADEAVTGTALLNPKVLTWTEVEPQ